MRQRGFTLVELMVVLLLIGIASAAIGLSLKSDPAKALREDAKRLSLLLQSAQDEARIDGRTILWQADTQGYRFVRMDEGRADPRAFAKDSPLRPRRWQAGPVEVRGAWPLLDAEWLKDPARIELSDGRNRISLVRTPAGRIEVH